jgi:ubiquitin-protein ligase
MKRCIKYFGEMENYREMALNMNLLEKLGEFLKQCSYIFVEKNKDIFLFWDKFFKDENFHLLLRDKIELEKMNETLNIGKNILILEDDTETFIDTHFYKNKKNIESNQKLFKRIMIEMMDLEVFSREVNNFYFAWSPLHFPFMKFIIGSENEPYYGGLFEFHVYFPKDYPLSPPLVHLMTTGKNTIRYNPNLYSEGKVCLSLLGTWSGEQWNPNINTFLHIVHAIGAMILTDQPVQNEPAYASDSYFDHIDKPITSEILLVRKYKFQIKYFTLLYAMNGHLDDKTSIFYDKYLEYFKQQKDKLIKSFDTYLEISQSSDFSIISNAKSFQSNNENIFKNYYELLKTEIEKFATKLCNS